MSTEFFSSVTGELAFVRWAGRSLGATAFEFGTVTNWETVVRAARAGETFEPLGMGLAGDPVTAAEFEALVVSGRASFGEFPVTVELGTGEMFRFSVEA